MKRKFLQRLLLVWLILSGFMSFSQERSNPTYYLNSIKFDKLPLLNTQNIDSILIEKKTANGEIYIYTKNKNIKYLSIDDILKKYTSNNYTNGSVLYRINGKIVDDLKDLRIDDTYFIYVETIKLHDNKYIADKFKELVIVDINLESEERKPNIIIRGNKEGLPIEMNELIKK